MGILHLHREILEMICTRPAWRTVLTASVLLATTVGAQPTLDQQLAKTDGARWFAGAFEASCEMTAVQGSQILQVASVARKAEEAIRESRRNGVRAVVFRGVSTNACRFDPLMRPAEMTPKADQFFDRFFAEGGPYLAYVEYAGDEVESRIKVGRDVKIQTSVVVNVQRLRTDLEQAGIIQSMSDIFRRP